MTKHSAIGLEEQLQLRIDKEFKNQLDDVITEMQKIANKFDIKQVQEKSPFKNVLSAVTEPMSSLEAIKVFIRYQVGRKESSKVWKLEVTEDGKRQFFADAIVRQIDKLLDNCEVIFKTIETNLQEEIKALEETKDSEEVPEEKKIEYSEKASKKKRIEALQDYLKGRKASLTKTTHLNLTQLFLGYLSREHTALLGSQSNSGSKSKR